LNKSLDWRQGSAVMPQANLHDNGIATDVQCHYTPGTMLDRRM
jgi:hypothetical protein